MESSSCIKQNGEYVIEIDIQMLPLNRQPNSKKKFNATSMVTSIARCFTIKLLLKAILCLRIERKI